MAKKNIILIGILGLVLMLSAYAVYGLIQEWVANPNNAFNTKYDVTCEYSLSNLLLQDVKFSGGVTCYYTKSTLDMNFGIFDFLTDKGTVKMSAQNKVIYNLYDVNEGVGASPIAKLTLSRLDKGVTPVTLTVTDTTGKPLDTRVVSVNIGG